MEATPLLISAKSQEGIIAYSGQCTDLFSQQYGLRDHFRRIDLQYARENDLTKDHQRAKLANRYGDSSRYQNITVPVVLPAVEAAVTYQSAVFLQGSPLFGVSSNAQWEDEALQMETIIDENATRGGWIGQFILAFRDGFKYNVAAMEVTWDKEVTPQLETDLEFSAKEAKQVEVVWEGNVVKHLDIYNTFWDTRVVPSKVHSHGEFAGYHVHMSRIALKDFINKMDTKLVENVTKAFESGIGDSGSSTADPNSIYIPNINPDITVGNATSVGTNWLSWVGITGAEQKIQYKDGYIVTTLYARILPSDFNLKVPARNTPQVWKFIIVNHSVVIQAERQTNAHGHLGIMFMQPLEDGLGLQTKSLATNVSPMQDISSAMWNSVIAARRRAIGDRAIYDPSRIAEQHVNSPNPSAKIPLKPAGYGKPVTDAYYSIPFRDDQSGTMLQESPQVIQMANMVTGQNPARQGQFVKGNKTQHEYADVMANANGRDQLTSMALESQFFTPLKEILKTNILQYQGARVLYNKTTKEPIEIDPVQLRKAVMEFQVSDGLLPTDKLISADTLQVAMQTIASSPQIGAGYNLAPMFSYFMKTQGAHITEFEKSPEQMAYEQAVAQWQQAMALIAESLQKAKEGTINPKDIQFPPQPLPEQFGYTPVGNGVPKKGTPSEST